LQTYLIRSVQSHASTFKTFALSFDVMNFQTMSKLKNSKSTYEYVSKYVQIYRSYISPNHKIWGQMLSKIARNSPKRQTKIFVAKRFQNSQDFRNLATNSPKWQPCAGLLAEMITIRFAGWISGRIVCLQADTDIQKLLSYGNRLRNRIFETVLSIFRGFRFLEKVSHCTIIHTLSSEASFQPSVP